MQMRKFFPVLAGVGCSLALTAAIPGCKGKSPAPAASDAAKPALKAQDAAKPTPPKADEHSAKAGAKKADPPASGTPKTQGLTAASSPTRTGTIGDLGYVERVFDPQKTGKPDQLRVLVMIHGLGDRPENFIKLSDGLTVPHRALALRGPSEYSGSFGDGYAWLKTRTKDNNPKKMAAEINAAADTIAKSLKALNKKEGQPNRRYVITGFSQGGIMSYAMAVRYPELVETAVPVAGLLPAGSRKAPAGDLRPAIIALHGEDDKVIPTARAEDLDKWLNTQGYKPRFRTYPGVGHQIATKLASSYQRALSSSLSRPARK